MKLKSKRAVLPILFALLFGIFGSVFCTLPAAADSAYDTALAELTSPEGNQVDSRLRHPYSSDAELDAMTAATKQLQHNGISYLWESIPETMQSLAQNQYAADHPDEDAEALTDAQLREVLSAEDLTLSDPAMLHERCWYDYAIAANQTGWNYAVEQISGYMFVVSCGNRAVALVKASYLKSGNFQVSYQLLPNAYRSLYRTAQSDESLPPILLTDPQQHQAIAFLSPKTGKVLVKNYLSSSSKDEILSVSMEVFQTAALDWNRDTLSVLIDANGNFRAGVMVNYNNLESYVRSELRRAVKENLMRVISLTVAAIAVVIIVILIISKCSTMFLEEGEPGYRKKFRFKLF
jgi:hypothetical protein